MRTKTNFWLDLRKDSRSRLTGLHALSSHHSLAHARQLPRPRHPGRVAEGGAVHLRPLLSSRDVLLLFLPRFTIQNIGNGNARSLTRSLFTPPLIRLKLLVLPRKFKNKRRHSQKRDKSVNGVYRLKFLSCMR